MAAKEESVGDGIAGNESERDVDGAQVGDALPEFRG